MDQIYSKIRARREALGLSQDELADRAGYTSRSTIAKIEAGRIDIPRSKIVAFARALRVSPMDLIDESDDSLGGDRVYTVVSTREEHVLEQLRALDDDGIRAVDAVLKVEHERCTRPAPAQEMRPAIWLNEYGLAAAGPNGAWFTDEQPERIPVVETPESKRADYLVRVSGDSMEPQYHDGDRLLVQQTASIDPGELGVFAYDGCGYFKKLGQEGTLISLNHKYAPIVPDSPVAIQGRVLGKARHASE